MGGASREELALAAGHPSPREDSALSLPPRAPEKGVLAFDGETQTLYGQAGQNLFPDNSR